MSGCARYNQVKDLETQRLRPLNVREVERSMQLPDAYTNVSNEISDRKVGAAGDNPGWCW